MLARRLFSLVALSLSVVSIAACAADTEDDSAPSGEGTGEDDVTSARQLNGSELAPNTINLTFDDGPGPRTGELADYLASEGIKATFFINGSKVPGRQGAIEKIIAGGHLLANHTHNHKQLTKLSSSDVVKEVADTDAIIAQAQPNGPWILRAPFGAWNATVSQSLNGGGMKKYVGSVFWDFGGALTATTAADWDCWGKGVSIDKCGDLYMSEIKSKKRGIVLMHDIHNKTIDMVKQIVPKLKAEGFNFVDLQEVPSVKRAIAESR
jgi:peptidoglycan-N-acetylglucosamine deacetylase